MRPYEVVLILDSGADEAAVDSVVKRVKDSLSASKGKVGQVEKWGRRRFAYELRHRWEGNYSLVEFNAEPSAVADLDRMLLLSDDVVRHKIVRIPESATGRTRPVKKSEEKAADAAVSTGASS